MYRRFVVIFVGVVLLSVLAACSFPQASASTTEDSDVAATVTAAVMTAVAQISPTATAETATLLPEPTVTSTPSSATATLEPVPTDTPVPSPATATSVPPTDVPACRTLQNLNLRPGPGQSYDPAIRLLSPDAALVPLAFSAVGFPEGQWVQVRDSATGNEGWVSAGTQFLSCNFDVTSLPQAASIPPTPTPLPTPTPALQPTATTAPVAGVPPRVNNNAPGGSFPEYAEGEVIANDYFLFRMRVLDTRAGNGDGAGIDHVEFFVSTLDGNPLYSRRENNAGYCIFGGGEPTCNSWPQRDGRYVWGGDSSQVQSGTYFVSIVVTPKEQEFEGETWNWNFEFTLSLP